MSLKRLPNLYILITPSLLRPERIRVCARLDALVATEYGLSKPDYYHVLNSFKFSEDQSLLEADVVDWKDRKVLRGFYGEVRKVALTYYDEISGKTA